MFKYFLFWGNYWKKLFDSVGLYIRGTTSATKGTVAKEAGTDQDALFSCCSARVVHYSTTSCCTMRQNFIYPEGNYCVIGMLSATRENTR